MGYQRAEERCRQPRNFRRIVIISGDNTRTYTFSPTLLIGGLLLAAVLSAGLLGATAYLVMRDDLIDLVHARNASMQLAYEDRIARLRSEIDKISSHQILDQVAMDDKIEQLMAAQRDVADRQAAVQQLIERAAHVGLIGKAGDPAPVPPERDAAADPIVTGSTNAYADAGPLPAASRAFDALVTPDRRQRSGSAGAGSKASAMLVDHSGRPDLTAVGRSLVAIDMAQTRAVETIAAAATERVEKAEALIGDLGIRVDLPAAPAEAADVGGPYVPMSVMGLAQALDQAESAFDRLDGLRHAVARLPLGEPLPGADITSGFGSRRDPFLSTFAFHTGVDFRSPTGTDVRPTAPGVVVSAGWAGGYGNMVEIDHGNGLATRYGHLSRIIAKVGDKVSTDSVIGEVGSTGRSTGPHLHYETRVKGTAVNPMLYISTGDKLTALLG